MDESLDYSYARDFQDYVREYQEELFTQLFFAFKTADLAQIFEGIKGEKVITQFDVADNLARRWGKSFDPVEIGAFKPRVLKTVLNKVDFAITPQDYEESYMGAFRKKGQNPEDWPFQAYIMEKVLAKLNQEFEVAAWQAVQEASPSAGDYLRQTFNGFLKIIIDAITAGDITPVATGAINAGNILANVRLMWAAVLPQYKENGTDIFMSYAMYDTYRIAYKDAYKVDPAFVQIDNSSYEGIMFELGNKRTRIIPINGLQGSNRIVITPRENLAIGIDSSSDVMFRVKDDIRTMKFWMDFRMGAQILLQEEGILVVNDQV